MARSRRPDVREDPRYIALRARLKRTAPPICWICGGYIDLGLDYRDTWAFSADHVVPIGMGGDVLGELRPAHRGCNASKGNRIAKTLLPAEMYPTSREW